MSGMKISNTTIWSSLKDEKKHEEHNAKNIRWQHYKIILVSINW